eukprot:6471245-Amphidinium_carterae.1
MLQQHCLSCAVLYSRQVLKRYAPSVARLFHSSDKAVNKLGEGHEMMGSKKSHWVHLRALSLVTIWQLLASSTIIDCGCDWIAFCGLD